MPKRAKLADLLKNLLRDETMRNKNVWSEAVKENLIVHIMRRLVQTKTRIRPRLILMWLLLILTAGNLADVEFFLSRITDLI